MARRLQVNKVSKRRAKAKVRTKKKDPIFVNGQRPHPMYVDYKDVELLEEAHQSAGQDHQPPQERLHGHEPARRHQGHQAGPLHGPAAVHGRISTLSGAAEDRDPAWVETSNRPIV